jgi:hypothetical protein
MKYESTYPISNTQYPISKWGKAGGRRGRLDRIYRIFQDLQDGGERRF